MPPTKPDNPNFLANAEHLRQLEASAGHGTRVIVWAFLVSIGLGAIKITAGIFGRSSALIADGVESVLDVFSAFVVWGSLKIAAIPPDPEHPYGHGKAEPLAGLAVALLILAAAAGIAVQSIGEILDPTAPPEPFTLIVLVVVVIVKELLARGLNRAGRTLGSTALEADAWHHRFDALTSAAAFVGIAVSLLAGPAFASAEDWAALLACAVIAFNGVRLFRRSLDGVMDAAPHPGVEQRIREIAGAIPAVRQIDRCLVRKSGLVFFVDIHVRVDQHLTVREGHDIAHEVKDALLHSELPLGDALVHIEPYPRHVD